jgi:gluconate 2-dehydrogenase gamma chain
MSPINRRDFIRTGGVAAAGLLYLPACTSKMKEESSYRFFTLDEALCLIALCEQIIPADEESGGATDAGVIFYIDRQLTGALREHASSYRQNLEKLRTHCTDAFGKTFQNLSSEDQVLIMEQMESNTVGDGSWEGQARFFNLVRTHTMQGFYGSPIHGGNKDYMSFNMLQLDYPLNIGQNRYRKPLHHI